MKMIASVALLLSPLAAFQAADASVPTFASGCLTAVALSRSTAEEVLLAADGQARLPIVVGRDASEATKAAARTLADYLERSFSRRYPWSKRSRRKRRIG
jgi:hypothetical protein